MNRIRKAGLVLVTTLLSVGALGLTAPAAHADFSWGCKGCVVAQK